ncbi:MAG: 2,3-butanediol dehydrogenase, partial [Actinomycetota bacterium]|nr:2,3-butanediol dehydrogenase [Actinomycetota bacterium]
MKAVRFHGKEDVRVEPVDEPSPAAGEVKLRNAHSGICGSDLHVFYSPETSGLDFTRPHPVTGAMPPQILGHEFSGTVVELGEGVDGYQIGDRVAVWPVYYCGQCAACVKGRFNACQRIGFHGLTSHGGGMAEFTTVAADKLHKLPDNVDLRMGALVEPMAVSWHAVSQSGVEPGQSALIAGAGPIGIGIWFALRARGVERILVSEPSAARRAVMSKLGENTTVDPTKEDLADNVADFTNGSGVDVAFDAAGAGVAVSSALMALTPGGRLVIVAVHERPVEVNPNTLVLAETSVVGALAYMPQDFDEVIAAMAAGQY